MMTDPICVRCADLWVYLFAMPGLIGAGVAIGIFLGARR